MKQGYHIGSPVFIVGLIKPSGRARQYFAYGKQLARKKLV